MKYWDEKNKKLITAEEKEARLAAEKEAAAKVSENEEGGSEVLPEEEPIMDFEEPVTEAKTGKRSRK